ncbi:carbamoyltransferase HypF [Methanimicrococcus blatticola]|uniref:Carbamoyltransferase n=1 Tax=Methanimicrococcus blatticola TaxID=91560 RepID=A0A484F599_9EURY|nr:carbamoyltransferase HypF [Methanimicrococcus blatticola]MBZ3934867.1 carbamoyltransferase HypF [Methanimicrococcus blatticola]MCC2509034.1 carbamoyltransferase HypF [Methanimicrococcus blatticola]TDQ70939.1 hydrogenase maturation protein HypF [Methanimicrococcus blatticola]
MPVKKLLVKGVVQGVGFRPFVYRIAVENHISGSVINLGNMVQILAAGSTENLNSFLSDLTTKNPPLSRIDELNVTDLPEGEAAIEGGFLILKSKSGVSGNSIIPPDTAVCEECLSDMQSPQNRRHLYPFTVCTNCGPRYTTVRKLPYDRKNTVMDEFPLCEACLKEYTDVNDRRYHAQPVCCPTCGPIHTFEQKAGRKAKNSGGDRKAIVLASGNDALKEAAKAIDDGFIVALKGDGGFHLVCNAFSEEAVCLLRNRLKRPAQPFAVMVRNAAVASNHTQIRRTAGKELSFLENVRRPIVVCNKSDSYALAPSVAPKLHNLGMMLPYSAAHYVLFEYLKTDVVVMTSANLPGLPMVIDNDDAFSKLSDIADYFLFHNRLIQNRTDDTVIRFVNDEPVFLRRSRGFVPERIVLPFSHSKGVAGVGAEMNNTLSFAKDGNIFLSQYIGNTKHLQTAAYHAEAFETLRQLTGIRPKIIACDMHPDFNTTHFAKEYASKEKAKLIQIQHHHAHICSVMADNDLPLDSTVLGIALDGVGYGDDQTVWGGEILKCTYTDYVRLSSLAPQPMAGGDLATKFPARLVFGMLYPYISDGTLSEEDLLSLNLFFPRGADEAKVVLSQLKNNFNVAASSSSGRVLDAAAALLGLCGERTFDGEPAMLLESAAYHGVAELTAGSDLADLSFLAETIGSEIPTLSDLSYFKPAIQQSDESGRLVFDTSALLYALYTEVIKGEDSRFSPNQLAALFVHAFAEGIGQMVLQNVRDSGIRVVCVSGGVANNDYIISVLAKMLKENGIDLLTHKNLPPGDGCISHGQVASVTARLLLKSKKNFGNNL